ncbi:YraN family protein [Arthrobacter crystallopoietes]|jgi:putative endonuclease|uniref:YraN family protein n=2 Tax=Micrococcaceae TaxID=1268 RepID=UPI003D1C3910
MRAKDKLGRSGETLAAAYLEQAGQRVVDRNWRGPAGEIDIVALEGATVVVSEVKTRRSVDYGHPLEAITPAKVERLQILARQWLRAHGMSSNGYRIDAVAVLDDGDNPPVIEHLKAVG